jgi:hypothetical protein
VSRVVQELASRSRGPVPGLSQSLDLFAVKTPGASSMQAFAGFRRGVGGRSKSSGGRATQTPRLRRVRVAEIEVRTPPRRRRPSLFAEGQAEPLHHELELALLLGRGSHGTPVELQTLDDWRRVWGLYGELVESKRREHLPGRRAFAAYVLGDIAPRPLLRDPPLSHRFFCVWVGGTGRFWTDYPEPYQRDELAWLVELGECADDEYRQALEQRRRPGGPRRFGTVWQMLGDYPLELGRFL